MSTSPPRTEQGPATAGGMGWLLSMSVQASGEEASGGTYLWKSVGGDFKASRFGGKEPDEKAWEPFHFGGRRCQGLRRGGLGRIPFLAEPGPKGRRRSAVRL